MDKLEYLQFSTEMPFGYLAFFGVAVLALIVGLILFGLGLRFRRWIMAVAGVGIAALVVTIIAANIVFSDHLDLNPVFSEQNIIGQWDDDDGSHLDINADHSVHFRSAHAIAAVRPPLRATAPGNNPTTLKSASFRPIDRAPQYRRCV